MDRRTIHRHTRIAIGHRDIAVHHGTVAHLERRRAGNRARVRIAEDHVTVRLDIAGLGIRQRHIRAADRALNRRAGNRHAGFSIDRTRSRVLHLSRAGGRDRARSRAARHRHIRAADRALNRRAGNRSHALSRDITLYRRIRHGSRARRRRDGAGAGAVRQRHIRAADRAGVRTVEVHRAVRAGHIADRGIVEVDEAAGRDRAVNLRVLNLGRVNRSDGTGRRAARHRHNRAADRALNRRAVNLSRAGCRDRAGAGAVRQHHIRAADRAGVRTVEVHQTVRAGHVAGRGVIEVDEAAGEDRAVNRRVLNLGRINCGDGAGRRAIRHLNRHAADRTLNRRCVNLSRARRRDGAGAGTVRQRHIRAADRAGVRTVEVHQALAGHVADRRIVHVN